jgi:DNA-binding NtrC family response regulator
LREYTWPGNVRELESLVRTYVALAGAPFFDQELFVDTFNELCSARQQLSETTSAHVQGHPKAGTLKEQLKRHEEEIIQRTLERCRYNRTETAKALGISINSLWRKAPRRVN